MSLEIHTFVLGDLQTNAFVLLDADECWVVDPGARPGELVEFLCDRDIAPARILLTHGHFDHLAGIGELLAAWPGTPVFCPSADAQMLTDASKNLSGLFGMPVTAPPADTLIEAGDVLKMNELTWQVLDTSGHTVGGVSYYCSQANVVLTGDALFVGGVGRTNIPGGDFARLAENIRQNLYSLPPETKFYPGHGPNGTIGREIAMNAFVRG